MEIPEPDARDLGEDQVILQMQAGAICGSDLPIFRGGIPPNPYKTAEVDLGPVQPGWPMHEVVGEVLVSNSEFEVGQRVAGWALHNNGLTERIVGEARSLHPVGTDSGLEPAEQVILQPLACVLHALTRFPEIEGKRAAVIGQGPIGLLFSHALASLGASHVAGVDVMDRSDVASSFGVDDCVHLASDQWAARVSDNERPEILVEAVGHQVGTVNHAIEAAATDAQILCFGICDDPTYPVDMKKVQRKELTLISGTTPFRFRRGALARAAAYIGEHPELPKIYPTHVFSSSEIQAAFECADLPARGRMKVAIRWS